MTRLWHKFIVKKQVEILCNEIAISKAVSPQPNYHSICFGLHSHLIRPNVQVATFRSAANVPSK